MTNPQTAAPGVAVDAVAQKIFEHLQGWGGATFGWQDNIPGDYERAKQAHADECIRRIKTELTALLESAADFDVRTIMLDVVPGDDGMGHEVYATSVKDVVDKLSDMGQRLENYELGITAHPPLPVRAPQVTEELLKLLREMRQYHDEKQGVLTVHMENLAELLDSLAATQPSAAPTGELMEITDMLKLESMEPLEGHDEIFKHYETTFGRTPDAFMGKVVAETKERLFMWWASHRDAIRAALVAQASAAPAGPKQSRTAVSSIDHAQQVGHLGSPEDWREACRLFRARHTSADIEAMSKMRTYIEEGLLEVVRPVAPPPGEVQVDAARQLLEALKGLRLRYETLFNIYQRPTYADPEGAQPDLDLALRSADIAIASHQAGGGA